MARRDEAKDGKLRRSADPLTACRPTRLRGEIGEGFDRKLVRVFGMQPLAGLEREGVLGSIHNLIRAADQVHFHASQLRVPDRQMVERVKVKIPTELTVDASQKILVETGGYALYVV